MSVAAFVVSQRAVFGVPHAVSCRALGLSESWLYKWRDRPSTPRQARRAELVERIGKLFAESGVPVVQLTYREQGFFTGRELYFLDPSGNLLELRDPTWTPGMPTPTHEEIAAS